MFEKLCNLFQHIIKILIFNIFILFFTHQLQAQKKTTLDSLNGIYQHAQHDTVRIDALINIAYQYRYSQPDTSLQILQKANQIAEKNNFIKEKARCLSESGYVLWVQTRYDSSMACANSAMEISKQFGYKKITGRCLQLLGVCFTDLGNYPLALDYLFQSLKINEEIKNKREIANCLNNIGEVYKLQDNLPLSLDYYRKAATIRLEINDKHGLARIYMNIADVYILQKKYDQALENSLLSLKICEQINNQFQIANNYIALSKCYFHLGKNSKSLNYMLRAVEIYIILNNKKELAKSYNQLAIFYLESKQLDLATQYAQQAYELADEQRLLSIIKSSCTVLYEIYKQKNNSTQSLYYHEIATAAKDSLFSVEKNNKMGQIKFGYELEKKQKELEFAEQRTAIQKKLTIVFAAAIILLLLMVITIFRSRKKLQSLYNVVMHQKNQILEKNEELNQLNEEITSQRDNMEELADNLQIRNTEITIQKNEIEHKNTKITQSIEYAKRIQTALLPTENFIKETFKDYFILFKPKDIVSGDFYWCSRKEDRFILIVADCTGHGVPGAFMSMLGIAFLNEIVHRRDIWHANEILNKLRMNVKRALGQTGRMGEAKEGMDIAVCAINLNTLQIEYAGANNPLYVVKGEELKISEELRVKSEELKNENSLSTFNFQLLTYEADKMPIGVHPKEKDFSNHEIQLQKGDIIYLCTDGFESQFGGEKGEKYKSNRLRDYILSINKFSFNAQQQKLESEFLAWKGENDQTDDVLMIGVKI